MATQATEVNTPATITSLLPSDSGSSDGNRIEVFGDNVIILEKIKPHSN